MSVELGRAEGAMSGVAAVSSAIASRFGRLLAVPLLLLVAMLSVATPAAAQDPVITSISPASGPVEGGNRVDIFGNNFFNMVTSVTVGGVNATIFDQSGVVTVIMPPSTGGALGEFEVVVTGPFGVSAPNAASKYSYVPPPTVSSITPNAGPIAGGTSLTITGTNFIVGDTSVIIGGNMIAAGAVTVNSPTSLTVATPAHAAGSVDVVVMTSIGMATATNGFTYTSGPTAAPTASSFTASSVAYNTGSATATTFSTAGYATNSPTSYAVGASANGGSVSIDSAGMVSYTPPAGFRGNDSFTFTATNAIGTSSAATVTVPVSDPTFTVTLPNGGLGQKDTPYNLEGLPVVMSGGRAPYSNFSATGLPDGLTMSPSGVISGTPTTTGPSTIVITATDSSMGAGSYTSTATGYLTINAPLPQVPIIQSVSPSSGPEGTVVTLTGLNLTPFLFVSVNGLPVTVTSQTPTELVLTAPAGSPGTVPVQIFGLFGLSNTAYFTQTVTPTITAVSPVSGPGSGGNTVVITGAGFTGASSVMFGLQAATTFNVDSDSQITVTAPAGGGFVAVTVTTPLGMTTPDASSLYTYIPTPTVTAVSPTAGPTSGGTTVTITGTGFSGTTGAAGVKFGAMNATSYVVNSNTQITATSPANSAGTYDITVTTVGGTSATSASDQYTYVSAPTVTAVSPMAGPTVGGATVTITGTNFTGATAVRFGGVPATGYTVQSSTEIVATTPANAVGTYDVRVTTAGGTSAISAADQYTYVNAPTVTAVSPTAGPTGGGTTVTITGTGFAAAPGTGAVKFGATDATYTINSNTQITATSPANSAGTYNITVTTAGGTSATSASNQYTYIAAPMVTAVSPNAGLPAGGTTVTITGTGLAGATAVRFGGLPATGYTVNSSTQITATSPANAAGTYDITVTTAGGTSATSASSQFIYAGAPTISSLSPASGPSGGGNEVVITGTNLAAVTQVKFASSQATFTIDSNTQITAVAPNRSNVGTGLTVVSPAGTSNSLTYRFLGAPTVTSISPNSGWTFGSTNVTITGANFTDVSAVSFGGVAATSFTVNSATSITATSPAGSGTVDIRVTTPGGVSAISAADRFTYTDPIELSPTTLPNGTIGAAYSQTITSTGGLGARTYSTPAGSLPAGLTLDSATGVLSGTPTQAGTFSVRITATDTVNATGTRIYPFTIEAPNLTLSPSGLGTMTAGEVYVGRTFVAANGTAPYSYAVAGGALPNGITLDATTGDLAGTPTEAGNFSFEIRATDSSTGTGAPFSVGSMYWITVNAPTLTLAPASLPDGQQEVAYSQTFTTTGGMPGYSYAVTAGALPDGLTLSTGGVLSGEPTENGTFNFTVTVTDSTGGDGPATAAEPYSLVIAAPNPPTTGPVTVDVDANGSGPVTLNLSGTTAKSLRIGAQATNGIATVNGLTISYTPTPGFSGTDTFTYIASNDGGDSAPATVTITVAAPVLALGDLPATGEALTAYSGTVTASLGTAPYSFARTAGSLPAGLTLSTTGVLSGAPTVAGTFNFTIEATDTYGATGTRAYSLSLTAPTVALTPAVLPDGVSALAYSQTLTASGGASPYSYAITAGAAPTGLALSSSGVLSGVAGAEGSFSFTVTATDTHGFTGSQAYTVTVADPVIAITAPAAGALPAGVGGTAYSQTFTATGGQGAHTFALASGTLPAGLTLSTAGVLSGTPTQSGSFSFTVTATDASPAPGPFVSTAVAYTLEITAPTITLSPAAGALPGGLRTVAYGQTFTAAGGTAPYGFTVTTGALPAGLTLATDGTLSGTPTTAGSNSFTVTATDAYGFSQSAAYTLEVGTPVPVVQPKTVIVVGGQSVTINAAEGAVGLDLIEAQVATSPAHGTATVNGLTITYTADGSYAGADSFTYTVTNPGGVSAPATVSVTVNSAVRAGPDKTVTVLAGQTAVVELTEGAFGSPFTGAAVVSVSPANAGTATVAGRVAGGVQLYDLTFKPDNAFVGDAEVRYTLSNAFATSAPGLVTITVEERPDPTLDAEVSGLITAQNETARRFATAQMANIIRRLEQLHDGRGGAGFSSSLSLSSLGGSVSGNGMANDPSELRKMQDSYGVMGGVLGDRGNGALGFDQGVPSERRAEDLRSTGSGGQGQGPWGVWVSGAATFGRADDGLDREGFKFNTDGLTIGVDRRLGEKLVLGGAVGWATDTSKIGSNGTRSEAEAWSVSLYGSIQPTEKAYIDVVLGYGKLDFDSRRFVTANGDFAYGRRDGDQWFGSVTAGWDYRHPQGLHLSPYGRIEASQSVLGAFTEEGGGLFALAYDEQTTETVTGAIGLRGDYALKTRFGRALPSFRIEYSYDLQGSGSQQIRYADWLDGNVYALDASPLDKNRMLYGLGLDLVRKSGLQMGLDYEGMLSGDQTSSTLRVKLQTPF